MSDFTINYDMKASLEGFWFRFPADDEKALWRGPYATTEEAQTAATEAIEEHIAEIVKSNLGLN